MVSCPDELMKCELNVSFLYEKCFANIAFCDIFSFLFFNCFFQNRNKLIFFDFLGIFHFICVCFAVSILYFVLGLTDQVEKEALICPRLAFIVYKSYATIAYTSSN